MELFAMFYTNNSFKLVSEDNAVAETYLWLIARKMKLKTA